MTYVLDSRGDQERRTRERARLDLLDTVSAPWTRRILRERGLNASWRCLEIGAGAGHLARWLAREAEAVVATDIDTYFLEPDGFEVRRHDILAGPVEGEFDLVVAKAVLVHLPDRERAFRHMAASLRPGGWIVVIDPSLPAIPRVLRASDPALHERGWTEWGRRLADAGATWDAAQAVLLAEELGLDAGGEGLVHVLRGGEPAARLWARTIAASADGLDELAAIMEEPSYRAVQPFGFATWAQRRVR
jgi:SAM-dependent methyltransferase